MKRLFALLLVALMLFGLVSCSGAMKDSMAPSEGAMMEAGEGNGENPSAGTLTAGEWKDLDDLSFWTSLLNRNDWYALMQARNLYPDHIQTVLVQDELENSIYNAKVELLAADGTVLYTARSDVRGYAYLPYDLNHNGATPAKLRVEGTEAALTEGVTGVTLFASHTPVTALDLLFMVDTTGSMADELRYLQQELADVIARVSQTSEGLLSIRVSVNFYRDEGDEYVILPFDFTSDIQGCMEDLQRQRTDGGGDYPEAVHKALDNAILEHEWRADAVKLMFFVLDAPPHGEEEIAGINAQMQATVMTAAANGIRIIGVASSGVNTETEFLLRSYAVMTGGTYVFLTDHSGVGNDHLEPTVGDYEVELLNNCLVRVISEYCGLAEEQ